MIKVKSRSELDAMQGNKPDPVQAALLDLTHKLQQATDLIAQLGQAQLKAQGDIEALKNKSAVP